VNCTFFTFTSALQVDDELKKIKPKDPKLMTARQRAMFERKTDKEPSPGGEQLLALPSGGLVKSVLWDPLDVLTPSHWNEICGVI
jgi:hypothetical protein